MTKLIKQLCEERIRELVPELKDLKFECEVEFMLGSGEKVKGLIWYNWIVKEPDIKAYQILGFDKKLYIRESGEFEVIGKKIELNHILLAIERAGGLNYYKIDVSGCFSHNGEHCLIYNLQKTFSFQSEPFYQFLYNIIK